MRIGIDISQLAYRNTGVANYLEGFVAQLVKMNKQNEYILFFSSLRRELDTSWLKSVSQPNVTIKKFKIPPSLLDLLWNKVHLMPIEQFIGEVDLFITSDWTEPPTKKAKKATILYDLIVYKYPNETAEKIVKTQKRKLMWVKKESDMVFAISESTKKDAVSTLGLDKNKIAVIYPGL